jgi:hypothetical protein
MVINNKQMFDLLILPKNELKIAIFIAFYSFCRGDDFADVRAMPHKGHAAKIRTFGELAK